jgi:peptidoglycan/xylan/chitin deacetylase (PgdA/CDA1 family)
MKGLILLFLLLPCLSPTLSARQVTGPHYLFFLHNRFIEGHGPLDEHTSYGRAEYQEILDRFRKDGFIVISEKRPDGTDVRIYAGKVKGQIDSLLKAGVPPENITVAGTSKGGYIAQYVSSLSRNPKLNFVFIGSSFNDDMTGVDNITLYGRVLSITEVSDTGRVDLSAQTRFKRSKLENFQEILLSTFLHHGFLFKALDAWIVPTEKWALSTGLFPVPTGFTTITEWQYGKNGAVSITYDDASRHQFTRAFPLMERLKLPATFFVITGPITGSKYHGQFVGRPVKEIINESASVPTDQHNFLERCSAAGYLGYVGTISYHTRAGGLYSSGKKQQAYQLMDSLYARVRHGDFAPGYEPCPEYKDAIGSSWDDFRKDVAEGYEIASHSITHATMPGMDEANIRYELEKSKEEIRDQLGDKYTFSTEVPYGYEDDRVMQIACGIYPALRNRMPEPFLKEIDRSSRMSPHFTDKDYVQWQRGPLSKTPLSLMKSWVDTTCDSKDVWLVLVFHGIDSLGWEPTPIPKLEEYFLYIVAREDRLWVASFGDVTKYMRERENAVTNVVEKDGAITVKLVHTLDQTMYDLPLTLKTYVPVSWENVTVAQGTASQQVGVQHDGKGTYILYQVKPNTTIALLQP